MLHKAHTCSYNCRDNDNSTHSYRTLVACKYTLSHFNSRLNSLKIQSRLTFYSRARRKHIKLIKAFQSYLITLKCVSNFCFISDASGTTARCTATSVSFVCYPTISATTAYSAKSWTSRAAASNDARASWNASTNARAASKRTADASANDARTPNDGPTRTHGSNASSASSSSAAAAWPRKSQCAAKGN